MPTKMLKTLFTISRLFLHSSSSLLIDFSLQELADSSLSNVHGWVSQPHELIVNSIVHYSSDDPQSAMTGTRNTIGLKLTVLHMIPGYTGSLEGSRKPIIDYSNLVRRSLSRHFLNAPCFSGLHVDKGPLGQSGQYVSDHKRPSNLDKELVHSTGVGTIWVPLNSILFR